MQRLVGLGPLELEIRGGDGGRFRILELPEAERKFAGIEPLAE
jgi:hypothetical protein